MKVMEPYMSSLFYPFKVKYMFGCTAIHEPVDGVVVRTSNQNFVRAVGDFWFSSWLPDAAAPENSPDTVNILAEADWRAYVQDCYALEQFYEEKGWSIDWEDGPPYPEGHPANSDFWTNEREDKMPTCFPTWLLKAQGIQGNPDMSTLVNPFVKQLHVILTKAHRWITDGRPNGSGGVVNLASKSGIRAGKYWPASTQTNKPHRWNGLWAITTKAARKILQVLDLKEKL